MSEDAETKAGEEPAGAFDAAFNAVTEPYPCLRGAEWWVVLSRGLFGARFGPYTGAEAGAIMRNCEEQKIQAFVIGNAGREFDYALGRDLCTIAEAEEDDSKDAER